MSRASCRMNNMNILGYIVQVFHEDKFLPDTGFKHLYTTYSHALEYADIKVQEYLTENPNTPQIYFEHHKPTKKQLDDNGYEMVFRNPEIQIWIETVVSR
jgi:hypothetical protein